MSIFNYLPSKLVEQKQILFQYKETFQSVLDMPAAVIDTKHLANFRKNIYLQDLVNKAKQCFADLKQLEKQGQGFSQRSWFFDYLFTTTEKRNQYEIEFKQYKQQLFAARQALIKIKYTMVGYMDDHLRVRDNEKEQASFFNLFPQGPLDEYYRLLQQQYHLQEDAAGTAKPVVNNINKKFKSAMKAIGAKPWPAALNEEQRYVYAVYLENQCDDFAKAGKIYAHLAAKGYVPAMYRHAMLCDDEKQQQALLLQAVKRYPYVPAQAQLGHLYWRYLRCQASTDQESLTFFHDDFKSASRQTQLRKMLLDAALVHNHHWAVQTFVEIKEVYKKTQKTLKSLSKKRDEQEQRAYHKLDCQSLAIRKLYESYQQGIQAEKMSPEFDTTSLDEVGAATKPAAGNRSQRASKQTGVVDWVLSCLGDVFACMNSGAKSGQHSDDTGSGRARHSTGRSRLFG